MELLSEQDSWNLFCLYAFPDEQQNRPSEQMEEIAHQVERECGRLPLAIKMIAASMASQKLLSTWESKLQELRRVKDAQDSIVPILRLSYDALPAVLKPCFLYFSFFGKNEEIDAEYLIYLWIGKSFIPEGEEQWRTGQRYLEQLNDLCLVEVSQDRELRKTCKIHDFLHDLVICISRENQCAFTVSEASANGCSRILLAKKGLNTADIRNIRFECSPSLRALSLSQNSIEELPEKSLSSVPELLVLDLSGTRIRELPISIGNFNLLRVLNLGKISFGMRRALPWEWTPGQVPDCVRNLKMLCFLDVRRCIVPDWIGDLKYLQHLHAYCVTSISSYTQKIPGMSELISLRTLRTEEKGYTFLVLKDLAYLIHLQELHVDMENEEEQRSLEEGVLTQLVNMRHLSIGYAKNNWFPPFPENMKAMKNLQYLKLKQFTVPRWICEHGNLRVLEFMNCHWSDYPALQTMPNLMKLSINGGIDGGIGEELPEYYGKSGAFPQLRYLLIRDFQKWPDLQEGAMPLVEEFQVHRMRMERIPQGLEHLRNLKLLDLITDCNLLAQISQGQTLEIGDEWLKKGGEYWNRIRGNNPHVTIRRGRCTKTWKSESYCWQNDGPDPNRSIL